MKTLHGTLSLARGIGARKQEHRTTNADIGDTRFSTWATRIAIMKRRMPPPVPAGDGNHIAWMARFCRPLNVLAAASSAYRR